MYVRLRVLWSLCFIVEDGAPYHEDEEDDTTDDDEDDEDDDEEDDDEGDEGGENGVNTGAGELGMDEEEGVSCHVLIG